MLLPAAATWRSASHSRHEHPALRVKHSQSLNFGMLWCEVKKDREAVEDFLV